MSDPYGAYDFDEEDEVEYCGCESSFAYGPTERAREDAITEVYEKLQETTNRK